MFWRWWRMDEEGRRGVWRLYGWFSGLMLCGSCFGAVAWGVNMQLLALIYNTNNSRPRPPIAEFFSLFAQIQLWYAAFSVPYAIEFLCLSVAKLMVLHRMADFAMPKGEGLSRRLAVGGRVVMAAVVVGNVVGLGGNVAASVYFQRTAESFSAASAAFAANNTANFNNFKALATQQQQLAASTQSLQQFFEVSVLLLIIVAFVVVGAACARRVRSALLDMNETAAAAATQLRRQIVGTAAFVFVTFLLRAVFSTMNALANQLQDVANLARCHDPCDVSCFNDYEFMRLWLLNTPEFQLVIELISSPLALLVALWGMTSERTLQLMKSNRQQMCTMRDVLLRGTGTE